MANRLLAWLRSRPWLAIAIGVIIGATGSTLVLRGTSIAQHEIFSAQLAMQGWVGALVGALAAVTAAMHVLRVTLRDERARADEQAGAQREIFEEQVRAARESLLEERRHAAWLLVQSRLQDLLEIPIGSAKVGRVGNRALAAVWMWDPGMPKVKTDVKSVVMGAVVALMHLKSTRAGGPDAEKLHAEIVRFGEWHTEDVDHHRVLERLRMAVHEFGASSTGKASATTDTASD